MSTNNWFPFELNEIQKRCEPVLANTNENVVITAPTGSGKTALFEMAMLRSLSSDPTGKIVFLAPMRAICEEKHTAWSDRLAKMEKVCLLLMGDTDTSESDLKNADILISTPEKWDFVTRSGHKLLDRISLVLVSRFPLGTALPIV
jgi:ATP-dependent DNA helicase HFM1/MER3